MVLSKGFMVSKLLFACILCIKMNDMIWGQWFHFWHFLLWPNTSQNHWSRMILCETIKQYTFHSINLKGMKNGYKRVFIEKRVIIVEKWNIFTSLLQYSSTFLLEKCLAFLYLSFQRTNLFCEMKCVLHHKVMLPIHNVPYFPHPIA